MEKYFKKFWGLLKPYELLFLFYPGRRVVRALCLYAGATAFNGRTHWRRPNNCGKVFICSESKLFATQAVGEYRIN